MNEENIVNNNSEKNDDFNKINNVNNMNVNIRKPDSKTLVKFKENLGFILMATLIFSIFFTVCDYKNFSGITSVFLPLGAIIYTVICSKKTGINTKKSNWIFYIFISLLAVNLFVTKDIVILIMDYLGISLLLICMLIRMNYDDLSWSLIKYLEVICTTLLDGLGNAFKIFEDISNYKKNKNKNKNSNTIYIVIGVAISIPLAFVVILLLSSADKFFADFIFCLFDNDDLLFYNPVSVFVLTVLAFAGAFGIMRTFASANEFSDVSKKNKINPIIAITFNSILGVIYLIFSGFQIFYLFLGNMTLPADYTFAEYAREGFFQLVFVCLLNMVLVLISIGLFEKSKILNGVLLLISFSTYIMIASSAIRMIMYVNAYQLTYTRLFVLFALVVIFFVMNGIVITIFYDKFPLFRYSVLIFTILYLIYAYSNPTAIIVKNNLDVKFVSADGDYSMIDFDYINDHLSTDGANEIAKAIQRENNEDFTLKLQDAFDYKDYTTDDYSDMDSAFSGNYMRIRGFNISLYNNYRVAKKIY